MGKAYDLCSQALKLATAKSVDAAPTSRAILCTLVGLHAGAHVVESLSRDGTEAERQAVVDDAVRALTDVLNTINVPVIVDPFEAMIKAALAAQVGGLLKVGIDQLLEVEKEIDALLKAA